MQRLIHRVDDFSDDQDSLEINEDNDDQYQDLGCIN